MTAIAPRQLRRSLMFILAGVLGLLAPTSAQAGSYTVSTACADWELQSHPAADASAGGDGCSFVLRNSVQGGAPPAGIGDAARWLYNAPSNTRITSAHVIGGLFGGAGWQAAITLNRGFRYECPGNGCGANQRYEGSGASLSAPSTQLALEVRCAATSCPRDQVHSQVYLFSRTARIEIEDLGGPGVSITGGTVFGGWRSGSASLTYDAADNVGIARTAPVVDGGAQPAEQRSCDYTRKVPCPNGGGRFELDTRRFGDGEHAVSVFATDSAQNSGGATSRRALIDNTPPAAPLDLQVADGEGWRRQNDFDVAVTFPKQDAAPIDGLAYRLCREGTPLEETAACGDVQVATKLEPIDRADPANGTRVNDLRVPSAGAYQARFFLRDQAGNASEKTAVVKTLRYDPDPPTLGFLERDLADPARLRVRASDATSGIQRGEIEVQKEGERLWRPLLVEPATYGFSALVDDEQLPKGVYILRARAVDEAGNEASSNQRDDGVVATVKLPVRLRSHLQVGVRGKKLCRGRGKKRACRYQLRSRVNVSYIGRKTIVGRLRAGGQPVAGTAVEVWRQTKLGGAPLERIDTLQTSKTGRFAVRAARGLARLLRFRYPGTKFVRGDLGDVRMRVRGATTFRPRPTRVVNGEYVTLRGGVRGGPLPATGKLVELQVFTRRQWRTFALPRTDAQGRWEYRYRFEQIRRSTVFRFRARLPAEAGYPFETGASKVRRILVRGGR